MFIRWSHRSRAYTRPWRRTNEPHRTLIAQLAESRRLDGKSKQRIVAHLGSCREPIETLRHRIWFYKHCDEKLAHLDLSADERTKLAAQLAARVPRPTVQEIAEHNRRAIDALMASFRPDGFAAWVKAWNTASEDERQRFLDQLQTNPP